MPRSAAPLGRTPRGPNPLPTLGPAAVTPDVAVLPADDHVDRVLVSDVSDLAMSGGVHSNGGARTERDLAAVAELELQPAAMDEVHLLLLVVPVHAGFDPCRQHDRVDSECRHLQHSPHLPKARPLTNPVDVGGCPALTLHRLPHFVRHDIASFLSRPPNP